MSELTEKRSNIYGLLSLIYRKEPNVVLVRELRKPEFIQTLADLGVSANKKSTTDTDGQNVHDLSLEYTRLFLGPGEHISPYESVHRKDGTGSLWGDTTTRVKRFIESTGLQFREDYAGIPDHISIELEFMQKLTQEESRAWQKKDHDLAVRCLTFEKKFVNEHLNEWIPEFCYKVAKESKNSFYKQIAKLTKKFLNFDKNQINDLLSGREKRKKDKKQ